MSFALARNGQAVEVTIEGELVVDNCRELKQAIFEELSNGARRFRIDLETAGYIDSAGLAVLVSLSKRIREAGADLRLAHLNDDLRTLFQLTRLDTLFRFDEDNGAAGRTAVRRTRPPGPLHGREQIEPPPP
jgi:anti-sigma B factor antagonist